MKNHVEVDIEQVRCNRCGDTFNVENVEIMSSQRVLCWKCYENAREVVKDGDWVENITAPGKSEMVQVKPGDVERAERLLRVFEKSRERSEGIKE